MDQFDDLSASAVAPTRGSGAPQGFRHLGHRLGHRPRGLHIVLYFMNRSGFGEFPTTLVAIQAVSRISPSSRGWAPSPPSRASGWQTRCARDRVDGDDGCRCLPSARHVSLKTGSFANQT